VPLVVVRARADDEHVTAVLRANAAKRADVTRQGGLGEARDLGRRDRGDVLADQLRGAAPAASESDGDVVAFDAGQPRDVGGGGAGNLERVGGEVQGVRRICHALTITRRGWCQNGSHEF
jgi:hypothetical protein